MRRSSLWIGAALLTSCASSNERLESSEHALSTGVVISQIYGGGGNATTIYSSDFVELFNRGTTAVSVSGWSIQYAAATGTSWVATALPAKTIPPGGYFLVKLYTDTTAGIALPTPDATGATNLSAVSGKIALVNSTTALTCTTGCATAAGVVDFVGYGAATMFEGTGPTPLATVITSVQRKGAGCTETDDNASDFATAAPVPRTSSTTAPCGGDAGVDTGTDTAPVDTGPADTGPADTGPADTGPADTGPADTGPADTGSPDTAKPDTATSDTATSDTATSDTATTPDAAVIEDSGAIAEDASPADAEPEDTGVDDVGTAVDSAAGGTPGALDLPAAKPACACDVPGAPVGRGASALGAFALLLLARRRRR